MYVNYELIGRKYFDLQIGDYVESRYRAHWKGTILSFNDHIATIQPLLDRRGNPLRKPKTKTLDVAWLRLISRPKPKETIP